MKKLILNRNLIRSSSFKADQKAYNGVLIIQGDAETKIYKLENEVGFCVTRFDNEFSKIYKTLRGAKKTYMWLLHNKIYE